MTIKTKINKLDLIKLKSFCTAKEIINKNERQTKEWEKIFANEETDKRSVSKIYKQLTQLNIKKNQKWAEDLNKHFSKKYVQMTTKCMKRCSTLLIIREMQIKSTMRYHPTPAILVIIKKSMDNKRWRGFQEKGTLLHCWWECKLLQTL